MRRNPELDDTSGYVAEVNFHRTRKFGKAVIAAIPAFIVAGVVAEQINSETLSWAAGVGAGGVVFVLIYSFLDNKRPKPDRIETD